MDTNNYQNYPQYEDPDYFADKAEAQERWEEWLANRIRGILEEQIELVRKW